MRDTSLLQLALGLTPPWTVSRADFDVRTQRLDRLPPVIEAARTIKRHWAGILRWFDSKIANGLIEGINSFVQAAKAQGYRSIRNLKAIIYLVAGKLDLRLPA